MGVATRLALPGVIETLVPALVASTTVGQIGIALTTGFSLMGFSGMGILEVASSLLGSAVAGHKMLRRKVLAAAEQ